MGQIYAAVDIGSNTTHLLVGQVFRGKLKRIRNESEWLGLGAEVARSKAISEATLENVIATLNRYRALAAGDKAVGIYVFATEAMRSAANGPKILAQIEARTKLKVDVVGGLREAELGLRGAVIDTKPSGTFHFAEVGGGSAQIARFDTDRIIDECSLPLGTGRLTVGFGLEFPCPPDVVEKLGQFIAQELESFSAGTGTVLIASGGVARGLVRALHPDGDRTVCTEELDYLVWSTRRLTIEQIGQRFGVKLKRAATLMLGGLIYLELMKAFGYESMQVSDYGVREGAVMDMNDKRCIPCPL